LKNKVTDSQSAFILNSGSSVKKTREKMPKMNVPQITKRKIKEILPDQQLGLSLLPCDQEIVDSWKAKIKTVFLFLSSVTMQ